MSAYDEFIHQLTPREREIALLLASNIVSTDELAVRLGKTPKTCWNQLTSIYRKLERVFGPVPVGVKRERLRAVMQTHQDAPRAPILKC